ncbi:MAG: DUF4160 domain-containing protein [Pyrinomonadaceae bacterium]|nr:DUF4160 domain-containing protein [Pyrinomonadaceae bacterium]
MPYVSFFFGIIIRMFHDEHNPPHFHAEYQGQRASFDFDGNLIKGRRFKSRTAKSLIKKWAKLHQKELMENWDRARRDGELQKIDPLD